MRIDTAPCSRFNRPSVKIVERARDYPATPLWLLLMAVALAGCSAGPTAMVHHSLQRGAPARPLEQIVLLPVEVDVYEMSVGGVKEEVPEWSRSAEENIRSAMLVSKGPRGRCCVTREVDTSVLTTEEREAVKEHLALFNLVANNARWATLPSNPVWHFKADHFDYSLGNQLRFLKTKYGLDAGLVIVGEDIVSSAGRKATAVVGAAFGVVVPLGHSVLLGGLVDFDTGDLLWLNYKVAGGGTDLRDPDSCLALARELMEGYPGLRTAGDGSPAGK